MQVSREWIRESRAGGKVIVPGREFNKIKVVDGGLLFYRGRRYREGIAVYVGKSLIEYKWLRSPAIDSK